MLYVVCVWFMFDNGPPPMNEYHRRRLYFVHLALLVDARTHTMAILFAKIV